MPMNLLFEQDRQESLAIAVLDSLTAHIAVLDARGVIVAVNEAWRRFSRENGGESGTFYIGTDYLAVCRDAAGHGDESAGAAFHGLRRMLAGEQDEVSLEYACHSCGVERWFNMRGTLCPGAEGARLVIAHEDITQRKQAEMVQRRTEQTLLRTKEALELVNRELQQAVEREQSLARTDVLTGLSNRRHFYDLAEHELAVAKRYHHPLSVILFDIDHFKRVNDTWGHQVGDALLRRIAGIAQAEMRASDLLARYGGEEFIVLLSNSDARQALVVAERIRLKIAADGIDAGAERVGVTISTGIAEMLPQEDVLDHLIRRADQALYRAKNGGRNRTMLSTAADAGRDALRRPRAPSKVRPLRGA